MQAVILAAGKGARLRPITFTTPKPLIDIAGKSLIEHALESLPDGIDEVLIVVNHLRDQIIDAIGTSWNGRNIRYMVQEPLSGTAGAVHLLREHLHESFLVINSDDLYEKQDLTRLITHPFSLLYFPTMTEKHAGALLQNGRFIGLGSSTNAVCGAYVLGKAFFDVEPVEIQVSEYREYGLPQTLAKMVDQVEIVAGKATRWQQVGTIQELKSARARE